MFSLMAYKQQAPYVILVIVLALFIKDVFLGRIYWNDPGAPVIIILLILLISSSMILGRKFGLLVGLIALFWPSIWGWILKRLGIVNLRSMAPIFLIQLLVTL